MRIKNVIKYLTDNVNTMYFGGFKTHYQIDVTLYEVLNGSEKEYFTTVTEAVDVYNKFGVRHNIKINLVEVCGIESLYQKKENIDVKFLFENAERKRLI